MVRYIESSLNQGFVKPREFVKKWSVRIRLTRHLVRYTGKFVISGVRRGGIQLYFKCYGNFTTNGVGLLFGIGHYQIWSYYMTQNKKISIFLISIQS